MSTTELFEALETLLESPGDPAVRADEKTLDLLKQLQVHQAELEIQNRELLAMQQQLAHSRLRYADLYDFSPTGYASLDADGRIEDINITGGKLLGENPHQLIGRALTNFIVPDDVQAFDEHLRRCRWTQKKRSIEVRLTPSGAVAPIDVQLFTMVTQDADRQTLQFRTALLDITTRKRAEEEVRDSQRQLEGIVAQQKAELTTERRQREDAERFLYEAGAILSMSLDYDITLLTLARAGIPHLADACVVDMVQDDRSIQRVAVAHVDAGKEHELGDLDKFPVNERVIRSGRSEFKGSSIYVPLVVRGKTIGSIRLILERDGRHYNLFDLALAEDLAYRAAIALDNATLYKKELEANRLKDQFLSLVSHELRTPLTPILGAIYKLRLRPPDEDLGAALDMIERNARAQALIVEDLIDISKITSGKLDFNRQPTDLLPIIQESIDVVRPSTDALGIQLEVSLDRPEKLVWCDRERIRQVIWNLLSNAIKFTRQGGTIQVRLESMRDAARISINDTGAGISPDFLPHVFDRFRQAGDFATRKHGGLGVGLSIVRYIVERHGGAIRAESRGEGMGAKFIVDLPYS